VRQKEKHVPFLQKLQFQKHIQHIWLIIGGRGVLSGESVVTMAKAYSTHLVNHWWSRRVGGLEGVMNQLSQW